MASSTNAPHIDVTETDEDLDSLLDDALAGFDRKKRPPASAMAAPTVLGLNDDLDDDSVTATSSSSQKSAPMAASLSRHRLTSSDWSADFLSPALGIDPPPNSFRDQDAFTKSLDEHMRQIQRKFSDVEAEKRNQTEKPLQEALKKLNEDAASLGGPDGLGEDDLERMLATADKNLMPMMDSMMDSMMQSLLSKELLYPAVRDLAERYPEWLGNHRAEFSEEQFDKYNKQFEIARQIRDEFEASDDRADAASKKRRFDTVIGLMAKMQELGDLPKELVGSGSLPFPNAESNSGGMPCIPGLSGLPKELEQQCKMQ